MHLGYKVADVVDLVVTGGVELVQVERFALLDGNAAFAFAAGFAVFDVAAVEGLGQDAGG